MPITHVSTATSSAANGTSISINRPANYASGDVFIAVFTSNSQNCTPPSGWTELFDEGIDVFRCQVFYKVTGGSEASSYNFSVPSAAPLVGSISAFRGVDTTNPIDIDANFESTTGHSEPYTPPSLSGGSAGRAFYLRAVRRSGTSPLTFTASGVTEVVDTGIYSGGSVCYSFGLYTGTSDYNGLIAPAPGITTSSTESHNVIASWALRASGVPGTMGVTMPLPTMTASGSWSHVAVVDADVPLPTVNVEAFVGEYSGDMDVDVPIAVDVAGSLEPRGPLEAVVPIGVEFEAETRSFGDNAIIWEREERWIVLTQEGYYLGRRTGVDLPMRIDMPLPVVSFTIITFPLAPAVGVTAEAFGATTTGTVSAAAGAVAVCCVDSSGSALEGVAGNAQLNGLADRVEGIRGERWYRSRPASSYALQLISASELVNVEKLLSGLPEIQENLSGFVKYTPSGRPRYLLFYGHYPNADAAREAIASIPSRLRAVQPWPRSIGNILQDIDQVKAGPYGM